MEGEGEGEGEVWEWVRVGCERAISAIQIGKMKGDSSL